MAQKRRFSAVDVIAAMNTSSDENIDDTSYAHSDDFESEHESSDTESDLETVCGKDI